jgi:hypothetical protein
MDASNLLRGISFSCEKQRELAKTSMGWAFSVHFWPRKK